MPLTTRGQTLRSAAAHLAKPGHWHLRTRLVAVMMALLTVICILVGMISYSAMSMSLNSQVDAQLTQAVSRSHAAYGPSDSTDPSGPRTDPLNTRGTGAGQLNAIISGGYVAAGGVLSPSGTRVQVNHNDAQILAELPVGGAMTDESLSIGRYRLTAVALPHGGVLVTGLPLGAVNRTLAKLVLTIVLVSVAGLIFLGLAGTMIIRRSMAPLEKLSAVATRVSQLPLDAGEVALSVRLPASAADPGTEVGRVGQAFNAMLENVSHALQARQRSETKVRRFVADASHELRTPLTAIRGYTELLAMTETLTPDGKTSLGRVNAQSQRMGRLVEDLLTLARLDEGQPLALRTADLTPIAMDAVSDVRVGAADHHWTIDVPDTPVRGKCDDGQLKQVLLNLLFNAAKHTPAGTTVSTRVRQENDGSALITVSDNGPGIAPDFQDVIFDRFSRADTARTGTQGSTGLGLSIVTAIMAAHQGSVELASVPGATTFTLRLPAIPAGQLTGPLPTVPAGPAEPAASREPTRQVPGQPDSRPQDSLPQGPGHRTTKPITR